MSFISWLRVNDAETASVSVLPGNTEFRMAGPKSFGACLKKMNTSDHAFLVL